MQNYTELLLEKLKEEEKIEKKLGIIQQEIKYLKKLSNLEVDFNKIDSNNTENTPNIKVKAFYSKNELLAMSTSAVQDLLNNISKITYIKKNGDFRTFNNVCFNKEAINKYFFSNPSSNLSIKYCNDGLVSIIEKKDEELLFKKLIKNNIISIELY